MRSLQEHQEDLTVGSSTAALQIWPSVAIAVGVLASVLYASMIPFDFRIGSLHQLGAISFSSIGWHPSSLDDVLTNFAVYFFVGVAIVFLGWRVRLRIGTVVVSAIVIGALLSILAESVQTQLASRIASWVDAFVDICGTICGALLAGLACWFSPLLSRVWMRASAKPVHLCATALTISIFAYHIFPFDFVRSLEEIESSFRQANWRIFAQADSWALWGVASLGCLASASWFGILAFLKAKLHLDAGKPRAIACLAATMNGLVLSVIIELIQLMTKSHVFESLSILLNAAGGAVGAYIAVSIAYIGTDSRVPTKWQDRRIVRFLFLILMAQLVFIAVRPISALVVNEASIAASRSYWLPFQSLWELSFKNAMANVLTAAVVYGSLAMTLLMILIWLGVRNLQVIAPVCTLAIVGLLELTKALASQGVDTTEPLVALVVAICMVRLQVIDFVRQNLNRALA